jgi:starch synthase
MRVVHLLRKYDPAEWGGTETAVCRLFQGFQEHDVSPVLYCPRVNGTHANGEHKTNGHDVKRFKACVPVWGISAQERKQFVAVGGNLMSFDLMPSLMRERNVSLIHTHTLGRLGAISSSVARMRGLPFVVSVHGGVMDLPDTLKKEFSKPQNGFDWGKVFGLLFKSRKLLERADAVLTCNPVEAALLRKKLPGKRVEVQPHGIPTRIYSTDHRAAALEAFPQIRNRKLLLSVGRIDHVKNQRWIVDQSPEIFKRHPDAVIILAGACTDESYGKALEAEIERLGLTDKIILTGGIPSEDPRLIGLFQTAQVLILPSISETFGLVLLESWAAGTPVISSRTSGASALIQQGKNGWLFDLNNPTAFHAAVNQTLADESLRQRLAAAGRELVSTEYDVAAIAGRLKHLYQELAEEKHALRHSA